MSEKLIDAGFDTWWVGGCVRDMLLGGIPDDIDIATEATPAQVCQLFRRSEDSAAALGSVRVTVGTHTLEITTFREDDEASDGRHPESIVFSTREKDARRRDITVNAIYWNPVTGEVYDPVGGQADLKERLIRFIGTPAIRMKHDALRILRAVRFRATLQGQYHPETYRALREGGSQVEILSGSRKLEELEKMLACPHPDRALEDLWELGILAYISPELQACRGIPQPADYHHEGDVWEHTLHCIASFETEDSDDVRLATLFHDSGKTETFSLKERIRFDHHAEISARIVSTVLERLQCPRKRVEKIAWLVSHHMMMGTFGQIGEERKAHWYFHPWFPELLRLFRLDIAGTDPADFTLLESILKDYHRFLDTHPRPEKPLLSGKDVMEILHLAPGEQVGRILRELHDAQIRGEVTGKAEAKEFLRRLAP